MRFLRRILSDALYELGERNARRVEQIGKFQREREYAPTTRSPESLAREKEVRARGQKIIYWLRDRL